MKWAEVNGTSLRYQIAGESGRTVVLIHEMGGLLDAWDDVVPIMRHDHRLLRYDTRGAGLSEKVSGTLEIETMADDLAALLDHLKISEPVVVAGVAVGAGIAIAFAARYPQRTAGLVAMSPAIDIAPELRAARLERLTLIEKGGMRAIFEAAMDNDYPQPLRDLNPARFAHFRSRWLHIDPESFVAIFKMLIHMDLSKEMAAVRCPTLVIGGAYDKGRPPAYVEGVAKKIAGAQFKVLQSGHQMEVQTPDLVAAELTDFIKTLPAKE
jgi:3-oxoadipate enol-lactonase